MKREASGEIVLAAGAIGTPQLLELSGVGRPELVAGLGLDLVHASPGVGENLQDHLQLRTVFRVSGARTLNVESRSPLRRVAMALDYALRRRGPLTMAPSQLGIFAKTSPDFATANVEFHVQPLVARPLRRAAARLPGDHAERLQPAADQPRRVACGEPAIRAPRRRSSRTISRPTKTSRVAVDSIRLARRLAAAPALARFSPQEFRPGAAAQSDAELARAASDIGTTIFHPVGTAKMGRDDDAMAVCDARLRVRGLDGLRIADASVMPRITSGNTNAPTMMIAEKAAAMMLADAAGR